MPIDWHNGAKIDGRGRPRVIDFKTTADIWWRKEHDKVEFGPDSELAKLSYYPIPEAPVGAESQAAPGVGFDPLTQFPGMTIDESFQLDVSGFLLLRGVLSSADAALARRALDGGVDPLTEHPQLQRCLHGMCGEGFRQDTHCVPMLPAAGAIGGRVPLRSVALPAALNGKDYFGGAKNRGLMPIFRGVRVCWALRGSPSVTVVGGSHLNAVETPACVLSGEDHLGASQILHMHQGDLLVCAATLLHGVNPPPCTQTADEPPLLVGCEYVCKNTAPSAGYEPSFEAPAWLSELTPEQQAVVITMHD